MMTPPFQLRGPRLGWAGDWGVSGDALICTFYHSRYQTHDDILIMLWPHYLRFLPSFEQASIFVWFVDLRKIVTRTRTRYTYKSKTQNYTKIDVSRYINENKMLDILDNAFIEHQSMNGFTKVWLWAGPWLWIFKHCISISSSVAAVRLGQARAAAQGLEARKGSVSNIPSASAQPGHQLAVSPAQPGAPI